MRMKNDAHLLDTDTTSNFLDRRRGSARLRETIGAAAPDTIFISIVTFDETLRGVQNLLNQARKHPRNAEKIVGYYGFLYELAYDLRRFQILPYDANAEAQFQQIPANVRQQHSQDCHIAAVALANDLTVVTSNTRHFAKIPGLLYEDWAKEATPDAPIL